MGVRQKNSKMQFHVINSFLLNTILTNNSIFRRIFLVASRFRFFFAFTTNKAEIGKALNAQSVLAENRNLLFLGRFTKQKYGGDIYGKKKRK